MSDTLVHRKRLQRAIWIAAAIHCGQFRKDGITPYIDHVSDVARRVRGNPKAVLVAWLHDTVEDCQELTVQHLAAHGFGEAVIAAVDAITKREREPYSDYLRRVKDNPLATIVKVQDMLSNLADDPSPKQVERYVAGLNYLLNE